MNKHITEQHGAQRRVKEGMLIGYVGGLSDGANCQLVVGGPFNFKKTVNTHTRTAVVHVLILIQ